MDKKYLLSHEELLNLPDGIAHPGQIPVHPDVYRNPNAYKPDFFEIVFARVHESIARDQETIRKVLNKRIELKFLPRENFWGGANPEGQSVDFGYAGSNIALETRSDCKRITDNYGAMPSMPPGRLMEFSLRKGEGILAVPVWYTHTPWENGLDVFLHFRNFAIQFNNAGVELL
jgi:hypothetical protein